MVIKKSDNELDFSSLEKGDFLSEVFLRDVLGRDPRENEQIFRFEVLNLRQSIWKQRRFTTRCEGFGLRILTDIEASLYNHSKGESARRKQEQAYERLTAVDEANLEILDRQQHRKFIECDSRILAAQQTAVKQIYLEQKREKVTQVHQEQPVRFIINGENRNGREQNSNHS